MARRIVVILLLLAAVIALYVGFFGSKETGSSSKTPTSETNVSTDPNILKLVQVQVINTYADQYGVAHVYGEVINKSDSDCKLAIVSLSIRDKEDNLLKKLKVRVRDIPSGQRRTFDIPIGMFKKAFKTEPEVVGVVF